MYHHLIVPTDGSDAGARAVEHGIDLARAIGAKVTILTVTQPFHTFSLDPEMLTETPGEHRRHEAQHARADDRLEETLQSSGVPFAHLKADHGHLGQVVAQAAEAQGCDLIVMPSHERYGLLGRSLDSETVKVLSNSRLPVLVVH
jgi:nucleotide-binding universal stress UspA family protein